MVKWYCDGCGCELTSHEKEAAANIEIKNSFLQGQDRSCLIHLTEIFCANCRVKASAYWELKLKIVAEATETLGNRLRKHQNTFFKQPNLTAVKK